MTGHRSYTGSHKPAQTSHGFKVERTNGMKLRRDGKLQPMQKPSIWRRIFG
jgi:hypothetical protein